MRHVVAQDKLSEYLLNLAHADGGPKAKFFLARGFTRERPDDLAAALKRHPLEAVEVKRMWRPDGAKLVFECAFAAADGTRPCIRTIWIDDTGAGHRRLVTAYPANPQRTAE